VTAEAEKVVLSITGGAGHHQPWGRTWISAPRTNSSNASNHHRRAETLGRTKDCESAVRKYSAKRINMRVSQIQGAFCLLVFWGCRRYWDWVRQVVLNLWLKNRNRHGCRQACRWRHRVSPATRGRQPALGQVAKHVFALRCRAIRCASTIEKGRSLSAIPHDRRLRRTPDFSRWSIRPTTSTALAGRGRVIMQAEPEYRRIPTQ